GIRISGAIAQPNNAVRGAHGFGDDADVLTRGPAEIGILRRPSAAAVVARHEAARLCRQFLPSYIPEWQEPSWLWCCREFLKRDRLVVKRRGSGIERGPRVERINWCAADLHAVVRAGCRRADLDRESLDDARVLIVDTTRLKARLRIPGLVLV